MEQYATAIILKQLGVNITLTTRSQQGQGKVPFRIWDRGR